MDGGTEFRGGVFYSGNEREYRNHYGQSRRQADTCIQSGNKGRGGNRVVIVYGDRRGVIRECAGEVAGNVF